MAGSLTMPRILLTVVGLWLAVVPPVVDFTPTHVFHPDWSGHARFHTVWLLGVNSALGLFALYLLWAGERTVERLRLAGFLEVLILGAFFLAVATTGAYGGELADVRGGVLPLPGGLDANATFFTLLLALALFALSRTRSVSPRP